MNAITVKEYISYLSGAYLFFELLRFDYSVKKQLNSPRKIYIIDTAFSAISGFSLSPDKGRILENIVFIELKRRGSEIFYFAGDRECDFIIRDKIKIIATSYFVKVPKNRIFSEIFTENFRNYSKIDQKSA